MVSVFLSDTVSPSASHTSPPLPLSPSSDLLVTATQNQQHQRAACPTSPRPPLRTTHPTLILCILFEVHEVGPSVRVRTKTLPSTAATSMSHYHTEGAQPLLDSELLHTHAIVHAYVRPHSPW